MKRFCLLMVALLSVCILCACRPAIREVEIDGRTFDVTWVQGSIFCEGNVYRFQLSDTLTGKDMQITYPDGAVAVYHWRAPQGAAKSFVSGSYDAKQFLPPDMLWDALDKTWHVAKAPNTPLVFLFAVSGMLFLMFPRFLWKLFHGLSFKSADPSVLVLGAYRILGGVLIAAAGSYLLWSKFY